MQNPSVNGKKKPHTYGFLNKRKSIEKEEVRRNDYVKIALEKTEV